MDLKKKLESKCLHLLKDKVCQLPTVNVNFHKEINFYSEITDHLNNCSRTEIPTLGSIKQDVKLWTGKSG